VSPQKRTHANLTIAQRAEHIFNSIKRQHISGNRPNINRLSVNPVSAYKTSSSVTNNDTDVNVDYDGPDFGTDADCPIVDESSTNTHDPDNFHHNLNPPPGIKFGIHLQHILSSHRGVDLKFVVHGFTSAHLAVGSSDNKLLFHANPYVYGGERYHFCMVQFYDDRTNNVRTCPARIMAFVQFKTKTFPVPDDATNALYAIVHTAREYLSWQEIEKCFVSPFILGDMKSCVYIVNTNNISDPLFVCPNYGQDGSHFLCCLPYRRWGSYFRYQLNRT